MSSKRVLAPYKIISAGNMASATVTSPASNVNFIDNIGYQYNVLSGTASGTFSVEVSADYAQDLNGNITNAGHWVALLQPDGTTPVQIAVSSGSPANGYFDLNQLSAPWVRLKYTKSSGTGTFDAYVTGKAV